MPEDYGWGWRALSSSVSRYGKAALVLSGFLVGGLVGVVVASGWLVRRTASYVHESLRDVLRRIAQAEVGEVLPQGRREAVDPFAGLPHLFRHLVRQPHGGER